MSIIYYGNIKRNTLNEVVVFQCTISDAFIRPLIFLQVHFLPRVFRMRVFHLNYPIEHYLFYCRLRYCIPSFHFHAQSFSFARTISSVCIAYWPVCVSHLRSRFSLNCCCCCCYRKCRLIAIVIDANEYVH